MDARQLSAFAKVNGFQHMADRTTCGDDDAKCSVAEALMKMLFWRRDEKRIQYATSEASMLDKVNATASPTLVRYSTYLRYEK